MRPAFESPPPFPLPQWAQEVWREQTKPLVTVQDRMRLVIRLALVNVQGNGHPFAAAVFELESGALVAIGINLVPQINCSLAHAEMVALATAQWSVGHFDLRAAGRPPHQLVTSCEPCAMCFGAIPFSGVESLACGARSGDAEAIGFDQAMKPEPWPAILQQRGIAVLQDVVRDEAVDVLMTYRQRVDSQLERKHGG